MPNFITYEYLGYLLEIMYFSYKLVALVCATPQNAIFISIYMARKLFGCNCAFCFCWFY